jgi:hypothetical protein
MKLELNFMNFLIDGSTCKKLIQGKVKKKSKVIPLHAMEALWGRGGIAPTHT